MFILNVSAKKTLFCTGKKQLAIHVVISKPFFRPIPYPKILTEGIHYHYPIENVMLLAGKVEQEKNIPVNAGSLITATNIQEQTYYTTITDENDRFILPVDDYPVGTRFRLSAQDKKGKAIDCSFNLQEPTYPPVVIPYPVFQQIDWQTEYATNDTHLRYSVDEMGIFWRNTRDARLNSSGNNKLTVVVDNEIVFNDVEHHPCPVAISC